MVSQTGERAATTLRLLMYHVHVRRRAATRLGALSLVKRRVAAKKRELFPEADLGKGRECPLFINAMGEESGSVCIKTASKPILAGPGPAF
jgi:ferric iron reductase protein FhuF